MLDSESLKKSLLLQQEFGPSRGFRKDILGGKYSKGGINKKPTSRRPEPPKGQELYSDAIISVAAIHEMGHALVAQVLASKVKNIKLIDDETGYTDVKHINDAVVIGCSLIAGHEAEVLFLNQEVTLVPEEDWKELENIGITNVGANILREMVITFLEGNRDMFLSMAKLLHDKRELIGKEFQKEIKKF